MITYEKNLTTLQRFLTYLKADRGYSPLTLTAYEGDITDFAKFLHFTDENVTLRVTANGFLYNMVRIIVGTAVDVSGGKINPDDIPKILEIKKREGAGMTAPARGLFLEKVIY
jgi:tRNA pseudouridine38-40 synthase